MKIITIKLSNGSEYSVDEYKFNKIIASPTQIIQLTDWSGRIIGSGFNKAHIVEFYVDDKKTKEAENAVSTYERLKSAGLLERLHSEKPEAYDIGRYYEQSNSNKITTYGN